MKKNKIIMISMATLMTVIGPVIGTNIAANDTNVETATVTVNK